MMNRLFYIYWVMVLLIGCLYACTDEADTLHESDTSTATVSLVFNTRANSGDIGENEGIKTLRIIVTDEAGTILYNEQERGLADVERHAVSIELPKTKVRFYVFANEESMGQSFDTNSLPLDSKLPTDFLSMAWTDTEYSYFPKQASEISQYGLPMTGCKGVQEHTEYRDDGIPIDLTNKTIEQIEIPLVRCVVKVVVNITNANATEPLTITAVNFGRFFTDKVFYYMNAQRTLPPETDITYKDFSVSSVTIEPKRTSTVCTYYMYPVSLTNSGDYFRYSIGLNNERDYKVFLDKDGEGGATYIPRNSRLTIEGTVTKEKIINWQDLILIVSCWEDKEMNITFD